MKKQYGNIYLKRFGYFNLYVIKGKNGDVLIDTGFIGMRKSLKRWLDKFNIKLVILTHAHVDHIWNASYIKKLYNCDIAIGGMDIDNIDNRNIHSMPIKYCYKNWTKLMNWGMKKFIAKKFDVDMHLRDNQIIRRYGIKLKIVSLPGHTDGSVGILYDDYFFVGDALVNRRRHLGVAYQNQNNEAALTSSKKIIEIAPKMVFVGHDKAFIMTEDIKEIINSYC